MIVMKFGGTSVGTGERIANVGRISKQATDRVGHAARGGRLGHERRDQ